MGHFSHGQVVGIQTTENERDGRRDRVERKEKTQRRWMTRVKEERKRETQQRRRMLRKH